MSTTISRQEDRQYERKAILFAVIFHGALLLICFFWIVLQKTDNEAGKGTEGVPINFGFDEMGSGNNNSMDQVATQAEQTPQEATPPAEASTDDANLTTTDPNAETVVSETKKPSTTPSTTPTTKPAQPTTPSTNPNAQMGATTKPGVNSGDGVTDKAGNQGSTEGKLDNRGYYGKPGDGGNGGNGALSMDGWHLDAEPQIENPSRKEGRVVFKVTIDASGEVIGVVVTSKTIDDAALVAKCKSEIQNKMEFVKNKNNASTAETSEGTITFVFRVN